MEFSLNEILQVLSAHHREGPEEQKQCLGCVGSHRPGGPAGSSDPPPPGLDSLIMSSFHEPFTETSPTCSMACPQKQGQNQGYFLTYKVDQFFICIYQAFLRILHSSFGCL